MSIDRFHQQGSLQPLDPLVSVPSLGTEPIPEGGEVQSVSSGWRLALREFADNRLALFAFALLVFFVLFSFLGPIVHPTNQTLSNPLAADMAPGHGHLVGTDDNGFDEFGRLMLGGQTALEIGFLSAVIATIVGTLYGAIAGLLIGLVDGAMMRVVDVLLSIPYLFVVLILSTKFHVTVVSEALIIAFLAWLVPSRLVRGEVLTLRERDFIHAATVMGAKKSRIVLRHLIPNALSVVIVNITFQVADAIIILAYLGFLGFGLQFPETSWGDMLGNAQSYIESGYWWLVYPVGACLVLVVLACNVIGDALRDSFDVRLRRR